MKRIFSLIQSKLAISIKPFFSIFKWIWFTGDTGTDLKLWNWVNLSTKQWNVISQMFVFFVLRIFLGVYHGLPMMFSLKAISAVCCFVNYVRKFVVFVPMRKISLNQFLWKNMNRCPSHHLFQHCCMPKWKCSLKSDFMKICSKFIWMMHVYYLKFWLFS